jgi:hypothetical protein
VYNLRFAATRSRATAKIPPAGSDCHTMDSEFLQDIALFREWRPEPVWPLAEGLQDAALSFVGRLGAADKRTASNIKPQDPVGVPRNADPDAFSDFALADLVRAVAIAREP